MKALLEGGCDVRAVGLAEKEGGGTGRRLAGRVEALAREGGVPVVQLAAIAAEAVAGIAVYEPEAIVAGCFPWRLPPVLLGLPRWGCLNVHPSLLPVGRGPEPVFWTLRRGERRTGATVHVMDEGLDTGPVVAREAIATPEGLRAPELEERLMALGGRLVLEALPRLAAGEITPLAQDSTRATAAPVPAAGDWVIPTNLPARWAYTFGRGVATLGGPLVVQIGGTGERYGVRDALGFGGEEMDERVMDEGDGVMRVRFRPGWVRFRVR